MGARSSSVPQDSGTEVRHVRQMRQSVAVGDLSVVEFIWLRDFQDVDVRRLSQQKRGSANDLPGIVASVRFDGYAQGKDAKAPSAHMIDLILRRQYEDRGGYLYYPSRFDKSRCDKQRRGTMCYGECGDLNCKPNNNSCWAFSFRWHLHLIQHWGIMLQVLEADGKLGAGQVEEQIMARRLDLPVVQCEYKQKELAFVFKREDEKRRRAEEAEASRQGRETKEAETTSPQDAASTGESRPGQRRQARMEARSATICC